MSMATSSLRMVVYSLLLVTMPVVTTMVVFCSDNHNYLYLSVSTLGSKLRSLEAIAKISSTSNDDNHNDNNHNENTSNDTNNNDTNNNDNKHNDNNQCNSFEAM